MKKIVKLTPMQYEVCSHLTWKWQSRAGVASSCTPMHGVTFMRIVGRLIELGIATTRDTPKGVEIKFSYGAPLYQMKPHKSHESRKTTKAKVLRLIQQNMTQDGLTVKLTQQQIATALGYKAPTIIASILEELEKEGHFARINRTSVNGYSTTYSDRQVSAIIGGKEVVIRGNFTVEPV